MSRGQRALSLAKKRSGKGGQTDLVKKATEWGIEVWTINSQCQHTLTITSVSTHHPLPVSPHHPSPVLEHTTITTHHLSLPAAYFSPQLEMEQWLVSTKHNVKPKKPTTKRKTKTRTLKEPFLKVEDMSR